MRVNPGRSVSVRWACAGYGPLFAQAVVRQGRHGGPSAAAHRALQGSWDQQGPHPHKALVHLGGHSGWEVSTPVGTARRGSRPGAGAVRLRHIPPLVQRPASGRLTTMGSAEPAVIGPPWGAQGRAVVRVLGWSGHLTAVSEPLRPRRVSTRATSPSPWLGPPPSAR